MFRVIPAARIGLAVLVVSFVLLSCVDLESRVIRANIDRYQAGVDEELDLDVLRDCGLNPWYTYDAPQLEPQWPGGALHRLADGFGWFRGRTASEIQELYDIPGETFGYEQQADLGQSVLRLTFDEEYRCQVVSLTAKENGV